jgi:hypothetical protein
VSRMRREPASCDKVATREVRVLLGERLAFDEFENEKTSAPLRSDSRYAD